MEPISVFYIRKIWEYGVGLEQSGLDICLHTGANPNHEHMIYDIHRIPKKLNNLDCFCFVF